MEVRTQPRTTIDNSNNSILGLIMSSWCGGVLLVLSIFSVITYYVFFFCFVCFFVVSFCFLFLFVSFFILYRLFLIFVSLFFRFVLFCFISFFIHLVFFFFLFSFSFFLFLSSFFLFLVFVHISFALTIHLGMLPCQPVGYGRGRNVGKEGWAERGKRNRARYNYNVCKIVML